MLLPKTWIICRVCLQQQDELFNLFDDMVHRNIWALLRDCGGVSVRKNDTLPDKICDACLRRLWKAVNFRTDCQRSHRELSQKQMKNISVLYEEEAIFEYFKTSKHYSTKDTEEIPQIYACQNNNKEKIFRQEENENYTTNINNEQNTKQYCIVKRTKPECKNRPQPIVLLLRLKNVPKDTALNKTNQLDMSQTKAAIKKKRCGTPALKKKSNKIDKNVKTKSKTSAKIKLKGEFKMGTIKFSCKICKKIYKSKDLLRHHMYTHKRPYKCKICHKKFSQSQSLQSHNNYHSGIKAYYCRICFKTFSNISNRNGHERSLHKDSKRFECKDCNKTFRFLAFLQSHSQIHKPKKCFICNKDFTSVRLVRLHHRRKHLKLLYV